LYKLVLLLVNEKFSFLGKKIISSNDFNFFTIIKSFFCSSFFGFFLV
jgi:hypothetical protein